MSKSLVYFLLFASMTSAYAEALNASDAGPDDLLMQPIAITPISVGQEPTTAELLAQSAHDAIVAKGPSEAKATPEKLANKPTDLALTSNKKESKPTAEAIVDQAPYQVNATKAAPEKTSDHLAAPTMKAENKKSDQIPELLRVAIDAVNATPAKPAKKPASGSLAEAVATAPAKATLDTSLFEQIHTATAAPAPAPVPVKASAPKTQAENKKPDAIPQLLDTAMNTAKATSVKVTEKPATTAAKVALDQPLVKQVHEEKVIAKAATVTPAKASAEKPFFEQVHAAAIPAKPIAVDVPKNTAEANLAKTQQPLNSAKAVSAQYAEISALVAQAANAIPKVFPENTIEAPASNRMAEATEFDKALHEPIHTASAAATQPLSPVTVSTKLERHAAAPQVVHEKALPAHVDVAKATTADVTASLTPATLALAETTVPAKFASNKQSENKISQPVHVAETLPAKALPKAAPGSLAGTVAPAAPQMALNKTQAHPVPAAKTASAKATTVALDKTLLQQIHTAKAGSSAAAPKPAGATVMLAENTEPAAVALEKGLHQNENAKPTSGLFRLPVVPVGRMSAAEKAAAAATTDTKPAAGSLGQQAIPVEQVAAAVHKPFVPAEKSEAPEHLPVNVATNLHGKINLDKALLDSLNAPQVALDKTTIVDFAPAMLAFATPANDPTAENTLLAQIESAKVEPVLGPKKPNSFSTAMITKLTGIKGKFDSKENVYKIFIPRNDLNIVVNGVKLTSAMGLTSWVAFKNTPDYTSVKGNLVLTEEQVNSVMFTAIENNLNVTELHNHYLWESPKVIFMHIEAEGDTKKLAEAVGKVLTKISESGKGNGDFPLAVIDTANTTLSPRKIEMILGAKGALTNGVYKIRIAKLATNTGTLPADPTKGANTSAIFAGSDDEAVMDGDIALQAPALQKVLLALHKAGISIVAIHQRMINDKTRYVFLHYWGVGKTSELARGLRTALDASVTEG
jgi:hypothetical protein